MYRDDNIRSFITQYTQVNMTLVVDPSNNIPEKNDNNNSRSFSFDYFSPESD